jgi:hypothetical protein
MGRPDQSNGDFSRLKDLDTVTSALRKSDMSRWLM